MKTLRTIVVLVMAYYSTTGLCEMIRRWQERQHEKRTYRAFQRNFQVEEAKLYRNFSEIVALNAAIDEIRALPEINPFKCFSDVAKQIDELPEITKTGHIMNSEF